MDVKLEIFCEVAMMQSFSKAAKNLHLSQPAVSKTVKTLEEHFGQIFFDRKANRITLTPEGEIFLAYAEQLLSIYQNMEDDLSQGRIDLNKEINIAASTTISNYILPPLITKIQQKYDTLKFNLFSGNTNEVQQLILKKQIDIGIVEGKNHNTRLHYEKFIQDELVLTVSALSSKWKDTMMISPAKLKCLPLIVRELGSGTREVIEGALDKIGVKINPNAPIFGSTESIKSYLQASDNLSFLSIHAVSRELLENRLKVVEVDDFKMLRWFYFINRQGGQSKLNKKIMKLLIAAYNQKL